MAEPTFFSTEWADAVTATRLSAGPSEQAKAGKLQMYWDFFEKIKAGYPASWALGCRDLPAGLGKAPAYLYVGWGGGSVTELPDHRAR